MRAVLTTIADFIDDASQFCHIVCINKPPAFLGFGLYRKKWGWGVKTKRVFLAARALGFSTKY
jgi:hypothetical protein